MIEYAGDENLPFKTKKPWHRIILHFLVPELVAFPIAFSKDLLEQVAEKPAPKEAISSVPEPPKLDPKFLRERRPKTTKPSRQSKEAEKAIAKIKMSSCQCGCDDAYGAYGQPLRLPSWCLKKTLESMSIEQQKYDAWSVFVWVLPLKCCLLFTIHSWTVFFVD